MRELSSRQTFLTKYFVTAMWIIIPIVTSIIVYHKFGQFEGFYMIPIFLLPALMTYMPMKVSFDNKNIVVSDWFNKEHYEFLDIKSLEYSRPTIAFHPYQQLQITTLNNTVRKVKFIPRTSDTFNSIFKKGLQGRQKELIEAWKSALTPT